MSPEEKKQRQPGRPPATPPPRRRRRDGDDGRKNPMGSRETLRILFLLAIAVAFIYGLRSFESYANFREIRLTYSQFQELLAAGDGITRMTVIQKGINRAVVHGEVKETAVFGRAPSIKNPGNARNFSVNLPFIDSAMLAEWNRRGIQYDFEQEKMDWGEILMNVLPWVLIIGFWLFMMRSMQAGQKGIFSFGKSRAKLHVMDRPKTTFADAAGVDEAKMELQEIIEFLKDPLRFKRLGGKIPKGVLLLGPPGTGKRRIRFRGDVRRGGRFAGP
jgi:cell division protease FtsH